jgi:hypothetical protein
MRIAVKRLDRDGRYLTSIARDDGVSFSMQGVGHNFAIPHDAAHYVVEKALRLDRGFWGSVAAGAVFPSMVYLAGRRKPKAAERSGSILKQNAGELGAVEVLVRIFNDTIEQGHGETSTVLYGRLAERRASSAGGSRSIGGAEISQVFATYADILSRWQDTAVGSTLDLHWEGSVGRQRPPR